MGIRFYCPNGHKVNVKDHQAGQKGLCPTCGVKMQIPWQSNRPSSKEESRLQGGGVEAPPRPRESTSPATTPTATPAPTAFSAAPGESADPLIEAGGRVWYIRPPSGGQFGPAASDVMQTWLAEGRVSADALVWREGWRDWREASSVFPQLSSAETIVSLDEIVTESLAAPVSMRRAHNPWQSRRSQVMVIGGLVATILILSLILLAILLRQ